MKKASFIVNISACGLSTLLTLIVFIVLAIIEGTEPLVAYFILPFSIAFSIIELVFYCIFFKKIEIRTKMHKVLLGINIAILASTFLTLVLCISLESYYVDSIQAGGYTYSPYTDGYWAAIVPLLLSLGYLPNAIDTFNKFKRENASLSASSTIESPVQKVINIQNNVNPVEKIKELNELRRTGAIDEETYREKSQKYIDML